MLEESQEYEAQDEIPYIPSTEFPQDGAPSPAILPTEEYIIPTQPPSAYIVPNKPLKVHKKSRRWIGISIILLLLVASVSAFFVIRYTNRSMPNRTLTTFCGALQQKDYQSAYNQFSPKLQKTFSESTFARAFDLNPVTTCTYHPIDENGKSVTTNLKIVHGLVGTNNDSITLILDNDNIWKIDDAYKLE